LKKELQIDANKHSIEARQVFERDKPQINADERRFNESVSMYKVVRDLWNCIHEITQLFNQISIFEKIYTEGRY